MNFSSVKLLFLLIFDILSGLTSIKQYFVFTEHAENQKTQSPIHREESKNGYAHYGGNAGKKQHFEMQREIKNNSNPQSIGKLVKTQNAQCCEI